MSARAVSLVGAQAFSSGGNFLLTVLVARTTTVSEFAAFALAFPLYALAAQYVRVAQLVPRQVRCFAGEGDIHRIDALVPAFRVVSALAVAGASFWLLAGGTLGVWVAAVSAGSLPAIAYDVMRNELIVRSREHRVAVYDVAWVLCQLGLVGGAYLANVSSGLAMFAAWALPPGLLAVILWFDLGRPRLRPSPRTSQNWGTRADGAVDLLGSIVSLQLVPYIVLSFAGTGAAAGFRGGQMLLGPANVLVSGLAPFLQRAVARDRNHPARVKRSVRRHTLCILMLSVPYGSLFVIMNDRVGEMLLGSTWSVTAPMMPGLVLLMVARIPFGSITIALRSLRAQRLLSKLRLVAYCLLTIGAVVGSTVVDLAYLPVTMAGAAALTGLLGWNAMARTLRKRPNGSSVQTETDPRLGADRYTRHDRHMSRGD